MQVWSDHQHEIKLLLADIYMPGMSGCDVADNLLALNPALKIVFLSSGWAEYSSQEQPRRNGSIFLAKPCPPATLRAAIESQLRAARN